MGKEAACNVTWKGQRKTAKVHLDSQKLDVYLQPALHWPVSGISHALVKGPYLMLKIAGDQLLLELGEGTAEKWAKAITQPKSRIEKLGIKPGDGPVSVLNLTDKVFADELRTVAGKFTTRLAKRSKWIFFFPHTPDDLNRLPELREHLLEDGAIWLIRTKGKTGPISESLMRERCQQAGLVSTKVASISDTLTADKWLIPLANR